MQMKIPTALFRPALAIASSKKRTSLKHGPSKKQRSSQTIAQSPLQMKPKAPMLKMRKIAQPKSDREQVLPVGRRESLFSPCRTPSEIFSNFSQLCDNESVANEDVVTMKPAVPACLTEPAPVSRRNSRLQAGKDQTSQV